MAESWRDVIWPREHGSWSLAFEPVALGLIAAPGVRGGFLAFACAAVFFLRRPLWVLAREPSGSPRSATAWRLTAVLGAVALAAAWGAFLHGGGNLPWPWLIPCVAGGIAFWWFDRQGEGRATAAEVAGCAAFGWLPAVFGILAGWPAPAAAALGCVMVGRSLSVVLAVRAYLRRSKGQSAAAGTADSGAVWAALAAIAAVTVSSMLAWRGLAPAWAPVFAALGALRSGWFLLWPRPKVRARTLGIQEAVFGAVFVLVLGLTWR